MYDVRFLKGAVEDIAKLKRQEPSAYKKAIKLIDELYEHPKTGTGKPEPLRGDKVGAMVASHYEKAPFGLRNS